MTKRSLAALAAATSGLAMIAPAAAEAQAVAGPVPPCVQGGALGNYAFSGFAPFTVVEPVAGGTVTAIGSEGSGETGAGTVGVYLNGKYTLSGTTTLVPAVAFEPTSLLFQTYQNPAGPLVPAVPTTVINGSYGISPSSAGRPKSTRTWTFAGFPAGKVYGHVRYHGRTLGTYTFGTSSGACGTLTKKAPLLPRGSAHRNSTYTIQIDQARSYKRSTTAPAMKLRCEYTSCTGDLAKAPGSPVA